MHVLHNWTNLAEQKVCAQMGESSRAIISHGVIFNYEQMKSMQKSRKYITFTSAVLC